LSRSLLLIFALPPSFGDGLEGSPPPNATGELIEGALREDSVGALAESIEFRLLAAAVGLRESCEGRRVEDWLSATGTSTKGTTVRVVGEVRVVNVDVRGELVVVESTGSRGASARVDEHLCSVHIVDPGAVRER
jgi:hypothetical protein